MTDPPSAPPRSPGDTPLITLMPVLFVLLWSTGFIGAKLGLPHAEPATFLLLRFLVVITVLVVAALVVGAPWPKSWRAVGKIAIAGVLIHGIYLGGVFAAIDHGLPAGVAALIVGLQPLLTALAAGPYLGERVTPRQWLGVVTGLVGVGLVVIDKLTLGAGHLTGIAFAVAALFGITIGTLFQKRHGSGMDLRTGSAIQFAAAAVLIAGAALLFETMVVQWTGDFVFALFWLCFVLSLGAITLLHLLIRRGAAAKVASLFYLVPPVTAMIAFFLFGETLGPTAILGMALTVVGVWLVTRA